jgi:acyl-coenzyme A thioesterase PaaI-like protein
MSSEVLVQRLEKYLDFTSSENVNGLAIDVHVTGDIASSDVTIPESMTGWRGPTQSYAHKGAIATVLETVMAFGGIHFLKVATNAKTLCVEYFSQVPVATKLIAEATLVGKRGNVEAVLEGVLKDSSGAILARSTGTYALYTTEELLSTDGVFADLARGPNLRNAAACRPEDVTRFEETLRRM